jgi:hypothetical protein
MTILGRLEIAFALIVAGALTLIIVLAYAFKIHIPFDNGC